jgi:hypothetical protein
MHLMALLVLRAIQNEEDSFWVLLSVMKDVVPEYYGQHGMKAGAFRSDPYPDGQEGLSMRADSTSIEYSDAGYKAPGEADARGSAERVGPLQYTGHLTAGCTLRTATELSSGAT